MGIKDIVLFIPRLIPEEWRPWLALIGVIGIMISLLQGKILAIGISAFLLYLSSGDW